jgi:hypothetical protein
MFPMRSKSAGTERSPALRRCVLSLLKDGSIGLRSGEYGGCTCRKLKLEQRSEARNESAAGSALAGGRL